MIGIATLLGVAAMAAPQDAQPPLELSVYFRGGSDQMPPAARELVEMAAERLREARPVRIHVGGHTARAGDEGENEELSLRRAMAVRDALVDLGVRDDVVSVEAFGEREPARPTADGEPEPANDRVVVRAEF